jgi:hypothetical protein
MSRLDNLSSEAKKQIFSPESDSDLIVLLTFYDSTTDLPLARICDGYTGRITAASSPAQNTDILTTDTEVIYGVVSRNTNYTFLPLQITLPSEEEAQAPRCSIQINDATLYLTPIIRSLSGPPRVKLELVLSKTPNVVEVSFDYLYVNSITYNRDTVNCDLSMVSYEREPFPVHSFNPPNFPGLF